MDWTRLLIGLLPPLTSEGRENSLNFIIWYRYSTGEGGVVISRVTRRAALAAIPTRSLCLSLAVLTIMTPGHKDVLKSTVGLVHAEFCAAMIKR